MALLPAQHPARATRHGFPRAFPGGGAPGARGGGLGTAPAQSVTPPASERSVLQRPLGDVRDAATFPEARGRPALADGAPAGAAVGPVGAGKVRARLTRCGCGADVRGGRRVLLRACTRLRGDSRRLPPPRLRARAGWPGSCADGLAR